MKLETLLSLKNRKILAKANKAYRWDRPTTLMTTTSFEALHAVGTGCPNGESGLVELITTHQEVEVKLVKQEKGQFRIYLKNVAKASRQGFSHQHQKDKYMIVVRKGKNTEYIGFNEFDDRGLTVGYRAKSYFSGDYVAKFNDEDFDYEIKTFTRDFETDYKEYKNHAIFKQLETAGYTVLDAFCYHESLWLSPQYIDVKGFSVEFGIKTNHTYHSLPKMIKFNFMPKLKTVKLADLGIETSGYYSHDAKHSVVASQVDEAKDFAKAFARKSKIKV